MVTQTTAGIRISVENFYQESFSAPRAGKYFFAYRVTISNHSPQAVQLLSRYWHITDGDGSTREVEGEGVVGQQPLIEPGDTFEYMSGCPLSHGLGKMRGHYVMRQGPAGALMAVQIPEFHMVAPDRLN